MLIFGLPRPQIKNTRAHSSQRKRQLRSMQRTKSIFFNNESRRIRRLSLNTSSNKSLKALVRLRLPHSRIYIHLHLPLPGILFACSSELFPFKRSFVYYISIICLDIIQSHADAMLSTVHCTLIRCIISHLDTMHSVALVCEV